MLMNFQSPVHGRGAVGLTLVGLCVGGAITACLLSARPTYIAAVVGLLGGALLGVATYSLVEPVRNRHLKLERKADARLASAIAGLRAGIALFDENDRLVVANPTYRQIHEIIADVLVPVNAPP
jgi:PAS domain-containing protein